MALTKTDLKKIKDTLKPQFDDLLERTNIERIKEALKPQFDELLERTDIENIRDALKEDFEKLANRLEINLEDKLSRKIDDKFAILISKLPDWSQFVTKDDITDIRERLITVENVAVGISRRFDQDLIAMQAQLIHHREWLEKHERQIKD